MRVRHEPLETSGFSPMTISWFLGASKEDFVSSWGNHFYDFCSLSSLTTLLCQHFIYAASHLIRIETIIDTSLELPLPLGPTSRPAYTVLVLPIPIANPNPAAHPIATVGSSSDAQMPTPSSYINPTPLHQTLAPEQPHPHPHYLPLSRSVAAAAGWRHLRQGRWRMSTPTSSSRPTPPTSSALAR